MCPVVQPSPLVDKDGDDSDDVIDADITTRLIMSEQPPNQNENRDDQTPEADPLEEAAARIAQLKMAGGAPRPSCRSFQAMRQGSGQGA